MKRFIFGMLLTTVIALSLQVDVSRATGTSTTVTAPTATPTPAITPGWCGEPSESCPFCSCPRKDEVGGVRR